MWRCSSLLRRHISYLTDVEGDMAYFQRFVSISKALRWERRPRSPRPVSQAHLTEHRKRIIHKAIYGSAETSLLTTPATAVPTLSSSSSSWFMEPPVPPEPLDEAPDPSHTLTLIDLHETYVLGFRDSESHFVYGGDAFDHGEDLAFAKCLLDLKARYPDRVHLILGNRDVNKMVMAPIISDTVSSDGSRGGGGGGGEDKTLGCAVSEAQERVFPRQLYAQKPPPFCSYEEFYYATKGRQQQFGRGDLENRNTKEGTTGEDTEKNGWWPVEPRADAVSFLRWALRDKLGSPEAFENRRRELAILKSYVLHKSNGGEALANAPSYTCCGDTCGVNSNSEDCTASQLAASLVSDEEVASSFFAATRRGGAYYRYLHSARLMTEMDGVLFVHGGVNEFNVGFVPSCERDGALGTVHHKSCDDDDAKDGKQVRAVAGRSYFSCSYGYDASSKGSNAKEVRTPVEAWIAALEAFRLDCLADWEFRRGACGEPLRHCAFPRVSVPYSVIVGSFIHVQPSPLSSPETRSVFHEGPMYSPLHVVNYLLASGVHTVCSGHQPVGDLPSVVCQPGDFRMIDADNSYSGRGNRFCEGRNRRGLAVMEVIFNTEGGRIDGGGSGVHAETQGAGSQQQQEQFEKSCQILVHGRRADGERFAYDAGAPYIGRALGSGWWVKAVSPCPGQVTHDQIERRKEKGKVGEERCETGAHPRRGSDPPNREEEREVWYTLHRSLHSLRGEEVCIVSQEQLERMLHSYTPLPVPGELSSGLSREQLADVPVHRIKTRVKPSLQ